MNPTPAEKAGILKGEYPNPCPRKPRWKTVLFYSSAFVVGLGSQVWLRWLGG